MNQQKLVSIIVPIYNTEKFLNNCMYHLLNQTYRNTEIILVNDGSTDNSAQICEKYKKVDSRIKYLYQKNSGVASARNYGLNYSSGQYVIFIDSDDYIDLNCIETCMDIILRYDLDIIKFSLLKELGFITKNTTFFSRCGEVIKKEDYNRKVYSKILYENNLSNVCGCIIKSSLIKNLRFNDNLLVGEDFLFMVEAVVRSKNIFFLDKNFYHYNVNLDSLTHDFNSTNALNKFSSSFNAFNQVTDILLNQNYIFKEEDSNKYNEILMSNILNNISYLKYHSYCKYIDEIKEDCFYKACQERNIFKLSKKVIKLLDKKYFTFIKYKINKKIKNLLILFLIKVNVNRSLKE